MSDTSNTPEMQHSQTSTSEESQELVAHGITTEHPIEREVQIEGGYEGEYEPEAGESSDTEYDGVGGHAAVEARGILDGIAESLRTLAGRQASDGAPVAIFPRGVDVLEVRMHISRDQDVDVNLRVAGPAQPSLAPT
jgi:hypothetical protein